jgi:hypothetical protein
MEPESEPGGSTRPSHRKFPRSRIPLSEGEPTPGGIRPVSPPPKPEDAAQSVRRPSERSYIANLQITLNDQRYISEEHLIEGLANAYVNTDHAWAIAVLCDNFLDPRGRLLGKVRDRASTLRKGVKR